MHCIPRVSLIAAVLAVSNVQAQEPAGGKPAAVPKPQGELAMGLRRRANEAAWHDPLDSVRLERRLLTEAIEKARAYYLAQQLEAGNFTYARNIVTGEQATDDNQVRQAGALWGLASLNRDRPDLPTARAVIHGLLFFYSNSRPLHSGYTGPVYPGSDEIKTGTVALATLAMIELWRGEEKYLTRLGKGQCTMWARHYLNYLRGMEMENGSWGRLYKVEKAERVAVSSAYYDGEALLAYCRAARYMGRRELIPRIERIAPLLAQKYTTDAWRLDPDSDLTKGFFQWGCMAFAEYVEAGWKDADVMGDACLALAWWQIHERKVETLRGNTAYAVEGLLAAYKVAKMRGNTKAMQSLRPVIERLLVQQISTQVGGPLMEYSRFLASNQYQLDCVGGIMASASSGQVRIDVVQHQVHAMLMALEILY